FPDEPPRRRLLIAAAAVALVIFNPIFTITSGRTWNHDLPTLLMMLALGAMWRWGAAADKSFGACVVACGSAGALMGLATGVRLTFAPPAAVFLLLPLMVDGARPVRRAAMFSAYTVGVILALVPALLIFRAAPQAFMFGNFT